ncbi:MAG: VWA domain-containing protein, partial [Ferruginibacter sp.]
MLQFQYPFLLVGLGLIPLVVAIFLFARYKKRKVAQRLGDPEMVKQLTANYKPGTYIIKFLLVAFAMTCIILAIVNLRMPRGESQVNRNGIDVMIALDVSKSMLAQDVSPTRLDRAKQVLSKLIDKLSNDRIGIVIFAGKAYLQMPLTGDPGAAKMYLSAASTESVPTQGTVIGDALKMCYASFNSKEKKYKAVVLISDGEDHDEGANKIASEMASEGVVIYTVGIGSPQGATLMDETTGQLKKDMQGNTVVSRLNEAELMSIAQKGNGKYQLFQSTDGVVSNLYGQLSSMDQRAVKDDSLINYQSFFQAFLGVALLLLLWELMISEVRKTRLRKLKPATALLVFLVAGLQGFSQDEKDWIKNGNEAYARGDYPAAAGSYDEALKQNAGSAKARYNMGNAQYKAGKPDDAVASYDKAIAGMDNAMEKADAHYNKGVVLQNNKNLEECIEAYKNALRLNPNHEQARQNLQKALKQQKQNQSSGGDKDKDKQDENKKDKEKDPKPQPSKLTKKEAEQKLKAL